MEKSYTYRKKLDDDNKTHSYKIYEVENECEELKKENEKLKKENEELKKKLGIVKEYLYVKLKHLLS